MTGSITTSFRGRAYSGAERQGQLVNFLKNLAMFGDLCFVAFGNSADSSRVEAL